MNDQIFDETGIEPKEQALWTTWTSCRGSLVTDPTFPEEKLEYFDNEMYGRGSHSSTSQLNLS
jgi:hypothetical protein